MFGQGKTVIKAGVLLPSTVTNLVIERPHNFKFNPGDWVFIKVILCASLRVWVGNKVFHAPYAYKPFLFVIVIISLLLVLVSPKCKSDSES